MEAEVRLAGPVEAEDVLPVAAAPGAQLAASGSRRPAVQDGVEGYVVAAQGVGRLDVHQLSSLLNKLE